MSRISPLSGVSPLTRSAAVPQATPEKNRDEFRPCPPPPEAELREARRRKIRWGRLAFGTLGGVAVAGTAGVTVATVALVNPACLGPMGPSLRDAILERSPEGFQEGYDWALGPNPRAEDPSNYGQLYRFGPGSKEYEVLDEPCIPPGVVEDGRVIVGFEGIDGTQGSYVRAFNQLFNSQDSEVPLNQDMLFIHEGHRPQRIDDVQRVLHDYKVIKQVQAGEKVDLQAAFEADPSVGTGYQVVKQALDQDLDVLIFAHSGGGAQGVEVLNLLASQGYRDEIHDHVRIMLLAGAAPREDALKAGVQPGNAIYLGMEADMVAQLGHVYVDPHNPLPGLAEVAGALHNARDFTLGPMHSPDRSIIPSNMDHVKDFFERGVGGTFLA